MLSIWSGPKFCRVGMGLLFTKLEASADDKINAIEKLV